NRRVPKGSVGTAPPTAEPDGRKAHGPATRSREPNGQSGLAFSCDRPGARMARPCRSQASRRYRSTTPATRRPSRPAAPAAAAAVREVLGPGRELMLDVNCNWTPAFAIRAGRELERFRPLWLEEPVAADDHEGSAEVARALDMNVAGYETVVGLAGWRALIER